MKLYSHLGEQYSTARFNITWAYQRGNCTTKSLWTVKIAAKQFRHSSLKKKSLVLPANIV